MNRALLGTLVPNIFSNQGEALRSYAWRFDFRARKKYTADLIINVLTKPMGSDVQY